MIRIDHIFALAAIETGISFALVDFFFASNAREATFAIASESSARSIVDAASSILAWRMGTVVNIVLAVLSLETIAFAVITSFSILTGAVVLANSSIFFALVNVDITESASPSGWAVANGFIVVIVSTDSSISA